MGGLNMNGHVSPLHFIRVTNTFCTLKLPELHQKNFLFHQTFKIRLDCLQVFVSSS